MKIKGQVLEPRPVPRGLGVTELVDDFFPAYNGARLREACQLLAEKILKPEVTLGVSLTGALTPPAPGPEPKR